MLPVVAVWLAVHGLWFAVPAAVTWITFCLAFLWPTVCAAYRTDDGWCEAPVRGWLVGCASHRHVKWRDLRALANPRNDVSPLHPVARALRVPMPADPTPVLLDGAPSWVTVRSLWTAGALVVSTFFLLLGIAIDSL